MVNDFDRYREAKRRCDGRIDSGTNYYGWIPVCVLALFTCVGWWFAISGYSNGFESVLTASQVTEESVSGKSDEFGKPGILLTDRNPDEMAIVFFDVGQGDAIFIQTPTKRNILMDSGEGTNPDFKFARKVDAANEMILPFFKRNNIEKLDYYLTTHPHSDHIGSAYDILTAMPIDQVWIAGYDHPSRSKKDLLTAVKQVKETSNTRLRAPKKAGGNLTEGQKLKLGAGVKGWLLRTAVNAENVNQSSLCFLFNYQDVNMLFTGDTEKKGELELIRKWGDQLNVDILKVGHHGSKSSTIPPFVEFVKPDHSVIMVGHYNTFGHPTPEVMSRLKRAGSKIHRTDKDGTITIFTDGQEIRVTKNKKMSVVE